MEEGGSVGGGGGRARARAAAPRSAAQQAEEEAASPSFLLSTGLGDHSRSAKRQRAAGDSSACGGEVREREGKDERVELLERWCALCRSIDPH